MPHRISITAGDVQMDAELNDTIAAQTIWESLPISASVNTWGDEIYFGIPVTMKLEHGQEVVEWGDLAYWPPGHAFCVFFGPMPASSGDEIRAASAVTVVGKVSGDASFFKQVRAGSAISISPA